MDQATAQAHLDAWIAADTATAIGKAYTIGNRSLTRSDAAEIRNQINYWERKVKALAYQANGVKNSGFAVAKWS